ncbi:MAG: peptidase domain-containing protein [Methanomicrobiaceae archaeon]|nr:peptidase domain-containing protein [Methanomicrobiaceae archaeon]
MKIHWLALLLIIGAALMVPSASAKIIEEKDGYIVSTVDKSFDLPEMVRLSSGSISQDETKWFTAYVPAGKSSFFADLNWGDSSDSLSLTVYAPDCTLGPYYDSADGQINGRINIRISKSSGIASGLWKSKVFGHSVSGVQSFSYSTSAS